MYVLPHCGKLERFLHADLASMRKGSSQDLRNVLISDKMRSDFRTAGRGRMHVLIADDHAETVDMLSTLLDGAGHHVLAAADGEEALNLLHVEVPDVSLIDLALPKIDGFRVATFMRKFSRF